MATVDELRVEQVMTPSPTCLNAGCALGGALEFVERAGSGARFAGFHHRSESP